MKKLWYSNYRVKEMQEPIKEVEAMTKVVLELMNEHMNSRITMEQACKNGRVKIEIISQLSWERRVNHDTVWTDRDSANKFYLKKINDGYKRV